MDTIVYFMDYKRNNTLNPRHNDLSWFYVDIPILLLGFCPCKKESPLEI